ncbi:flagellar hook-length control protein FliK [Roseibacterium sp. SDUM158016]|uniref:flagellar hook-length control protein FliK n=1 Tax=Roseicyclus sediminis TaxID=2980997 RepID=UPI0021CF6499|nr:flagellar hook-length control protein FliK [Roseibacterium sp. SDUM158016]MCU4654343.1 flagellar hook-length control protein FliK [Roseibacterium sp. SDUM158016]
MTATLGFTLSQTPAKAATAGAMQVPGIGRGAGAASGANPFAGLLAALQGGPTPPQGGAQQPGDGMEGSVDGQAEAQSQLLAGLGSLIVNAQSAFEAAQFPQDKVEILREFLATFRLRLEELNGDGVAAVFPGSFLVADGSDPAGIDALTVQSGPAAVATAILSAIGLVVPKDPTALAAANGGPLATGVAQEPAARRLPTALTTFGHAPDGSPDGAAPPELQQARGLQGQLVGLGSTDGRGQQETSTAVSVRKEAAGAQIGAVAQLGAEPAGFSRPMTEVGEMMVASLGRAAPSGTEAALQNSRPSIDMPPSPALVRHVADQISGARFTEGNTRIELTPRGLGDIEIDMRHDEAGKLRIVLKAENPAVLNAFRHDRDALLDALRDGGAATDGADLSFESFAGHQSRQQSEQERWRSVVLGTGPAVAEPSSATGLPALSGPIRPFAQSGLDIIT